MASPTDLALQKAKVPFANLYGPLQASLKSYLYRMLTNLPDTEDLAQDTYIKASENYTSFDSKKASFKTWVFTIATNLALNHLKKQKRWSQDANDRARAIVKSDPLVQKEMYQIMEDPSTAFEIREHINYCFNCMGKTLPIDQQVALLLKDVYGFKVNEISQILDKSAGVVKHLLRDSRTTMIDIFDHRCSLINKQGICHKCTELSGIFNPKQKEQEALMKLRMIKEAAQADKQRLLELRTQLIKGVDPQEAKGKEFHELLYRLNARGQEPE